MGGEVLPSVLGHLPSFEEARQPGRRLAFGTALASVGAGVVAQGFSWRAVFVVTGLAALVLAVALRLLVEPPRTRAHRGPLAPLLTVAQSRSALFVLGLAVVEGGVVIGALTLLPPAVEAAGASTALAGAVTAVYIVAVLIFASAIGRLSRRLHPSRLIALGATSLVTACLVLALSRTAVAAAAVPLGFAGVWERARRHRHV